MTASTAPVAASVAPPAAPTGVAAPVVPAAAPAVAVPQDATRAAPGAILPRITWRLRISTWLRLAYVDVASSEHRILLEWVISLVIVSVVATVLEHDPRLEAAYRGNFVAVESAVLAFFIVDYGLNIFYAPSRRKYIFSVWGLIDLMAILPGVLLIGNLSAVKIIRSIRFLRFLRVVKVAREAQRRVQTFEEEERRSLFIDLQLGVIGFAAIILFIPDDGLRDMMLGFALAATVTIGLRRWLVQAQHSTLSVLVLMGSIVWSVMYALSLDGPDSFARACGVLLSAVVIALISWLQIESPAGGL